MNKKTMNKKRIIAITIMAALAGTAVFADTASGMALNSTFKDTTNHWGKTYIDRLYKEGYVKGSGGYFNPNQPLKTEDFLIMAVKSIKPEYKELTASEGQLYYQPYLDKAKEIGLVGEYDEVNYYMNRSMPRELAAQMTTRAVELMGEKVVANAGLSYKFGDYKIINDSNKEAVLKAYQLGIIKGNNGNFEPKDFLTRAESAVLISKILDKSLREPVTPFVNPKTYGEIDEWYLNAYDKQVEQRAVVVERKANGIINDGDVDFKEIRKWWTDQEFEDLMISNISKRSASEYTSVMRGVNVGEDPNLDYTGGFYYVHNGELTFVNKGQANDQKSHKLYDFTLSNAPRLFYDLAKYGAQYAKEEELFSKMVYCDGYIYHSIGLTSDPNARLVSFAYYEEDQRKSVSVDTKFNILFSYLVLDYKMFLRTETFTKQELFRVYGAKDGQAVFDVSKKLLKNRDAASVGSIYQTVNGIQIHMKDLKGLGPSLSYSEKQ